MTLALDAFLHAARSYQAALRLPEASDSAAPADAPALVQLTLDGEAVGRLTAPTVSAWIAREARKRRVCP